MPANRRKACALGDVGRVAERSAALANHDDLHITLTLLIGVAVACGVLYWSGKNAGSAPIPSTSLATPLPRAPVAPLLTKPVVAQPIERASDRPVPSNQAQEMPTSN